MRIIIYCLFIGNFIWAQNINEAEKLMDKVSERLINTELGSTIEFEYLFENESHKMNQPINGALSLFSENRFYLKFNNGDNQMIQLYNGINLFTILLEEKEIQIDEMNTDKGLFIQNIFNNYKNEFTSYIKKINSKLTLIELIPKKKYNQSIFNNCIDTLSLPSCLKLPNQCKIGITRKMQESLNECLENNQGYIENEILKVEIIINPNTLDMESIKQTNRYNGQTNIEIKKIKSASIDMLNIDGLYTDFEIIDLR